MKNRYHVIVWGSARDDFEICLEDIEPEVELDPTVTFPGTFTNFVLSHFGFGVVYGCDEVVIIQLFSKVPYKKI